MIPVLPKISMLGLKCDNDPIGPFSIVFREISQ